VIAYCWRGEISLRMDRRYLVAVGLLAVLAVAFGVFGTVAPPLPESKLTPVTPQQGSESGSAAHFQNPPTYDSGWVDITTKTGQYVTLKHGSNTTEVVVDITGKQSLDPMGGAPAWSRTYGGTSYDYAYSLVQTGDGGYALAGYTSSYGAGSDDFWLVKTDSAGNMLWSRTYGGTSIDEARSLIQTSDGGYALAGYTWSYGAGAADVWLVKTDSAGNMLWSKTYGGTGDDVALSVVQTGDGGYALAGYTGSDFWLVKTDSAGNMLWGKTYGGTGNDRAFSVVQTVDGGYALAGGTSSYGAGSYDFWLVKTDSAGNMLWSNTYGGTSYDYAYSLVQTFDEGYALAGYTGSYGAGGDDVWLVKTDSAGNMLWSNTYGGTSGDYAYSLVQTGDGGYALAGYTWSYGAGSGDFWLVKTNGAGNTQWSRTYGGTDIDYAYSLVQTGDGGYALAGITWSYGAGSGDFWLVKVNPEMNIEHQRNLGETNIIPSWSRTYGGAIDDWVYSLVQTGDGGYALAGSTNSYGAGGDDFWLVKTNGAGNTQWSRTYGGTDIDVAYSLVQTGDGGYALAGSTGSDVWLVKTDSAGNMLWSNTYGGAGTDCARSLVQTGDEGYALAGYTGSYGAGGYDFWLVKTDSAGNMLWSKTYGGTSYEDAYSLVQTGDGGYALAGYTGSDFWLVKTDSAGNMLWSKTYGGTSFDVAYSLVQTGDGGYALAGITNSYGAGSFDFWLVKTDSAGNMLWSKTYGGTSYEDAYSLVQTGDGGYALAGYTNSYGAGSGDVWLVKTDGAGNTQWSRTYGGTGNDYALSLVQTGDGGCALACFTASYGAGAVDFWLVKTDVEVGLAMMQLTQNSIILYRGTTDPYWNYVRVRIWLIKEPTWIYGDINMDGAVDAKDLYIIGRNYGKSLSLLSLGGIIGIAGIRTVKKRKQSKQPSYIS
jgi:hypothetical protein